MPHDGYTGHYPSGRLIEWREMVLMEEVYLCYTGVAQHASPGSDKVLKGGIVYGGKHVVSCPGTIFA
jgi:hypothetical protein